MAKKRITLEYCKAPFKGYKDPDLYKVISVTNSVAYKPGSILEEPDVKRLCQKADIDIVIK